MAVPSLGCGAISSDRRESGGDVWADPSCHDFVGGAVTEDDSGALIDLVGDIAEALVADVIEVNSFWKVLPQKTIRRSYVCQVVVGSMAARAADSMTR
jgi:hypothetical protein